jgi:hypothetical protein
MSPTFNCLMAYNGATAGIERSARDAWLPAAHGSAQNAVEASRLPGTKPVDLKHLKRCGVCDPQSRQAVTATIAGKTDLHLLMVPARVAVNPRQNHSCGCCHHGVWLAAP